MRRTGILALPLTLVLTAFGCGSQSSGTAANASSVESLRRNQSEAPAAPSATSSTNSAGSAKPAQKAPSTEKTADGDIALKQTTASTIDTAPTDRKIIRNADLTIESETPEDAQRNITSIAERSGGFVLESQSTSTDPKLNRRDVVNMTVRVPSAKFADSLDEIRRSGSRVLIESVRGDDVTEEFIDIEARLRTQKALEAQFLEIMKRSSGVNEALSVQREIAQVRGEIEKIEGRKRFLENQSSLSTIKVKLQTSTATSIASSSSGFLPRLTQSLMTGIDFALNFVLGLLTIIIALLPFALFVVLPIYLLIRYLWRRRARERTLAEITRDEISST